MTISPNPASDDVITNATALSTLSAAQPTFSTVGAASSSDTQSYFRFDLAAASNFRVNLSRLSNDLDLALLNSAGITISSIVTPGNAIEDTAGISTLAAGNYFVRILAPAPGVTTAYDLTITTATTSDDTIVGTVGLIPLRPSTAPTLRVSQTAGGSADIQDYYRDGIVRYVLLLNTHGMLTSLAQF